MLKRLFFLTVLTLTLVLSGCQKEPDARLIEISAIVSDNPREALEKLDSIDVTELSVGDRHFRDFLLIKARDKAYITHQSDSLYLDVVKYYESHQSDKLFPEVLYYGGRVYSDLGDYPTALDYYRKSLDALPENNDNLDLRLRVISQCGLILDHLKLYDEAIQYNDMAIEIEKSLNDTINVLRDLLSQAVVEIRRENYREAEKRLESASYYSNKATLNQNRLLKLYKAEIKYNLNQNDSALYYIRQVDRPTDSILYNIYNAIKARVYFKSEMLDSAYILSKELIKSPRENNKTAAFRIFLSPELRERIPRDSIMDYVIEFHKVLEERFDENEAQLSVIELARYNYFVHEREKIKAQKTRNSLFIILMISLIFILFLGCVILYIRLKSKNQIISLQIAINDLKKRTFLNDNFTELVQEENVRETIDRKRLLVNLRKELLERSNNMNEPYDKGISFKETELYQEIFDFLHEEKPIANKRDIWKKLESYINFHYPKFRSKLILLANDKLNNSDWQTIMLIKVGFSPTEVSILLGVTKQTIVSRRESISKKIFGEKQSTKITDRAIYLL